MEEERVYLRCLIQPENFPHKLTVSLNSSLDQVKTEISSVLNKSSEELKLTFDNRALDISDLSKSLLQSGFKPSKIYDVKVSTHKGSCHEDTTIKKKPILRVKSKNTKPKTFEGGFRHKVNGTLFLNSGVQCFEHVLTGEERIKQESFLRDTQTVKTKTISSQGNTSKATQMQRNDLFIDNRNLKTIIPKPYFSYKQLLEVQTRVCLRLQCFYRTLKARRILRKLRRKKENKQLQKENQIEKARLERYENFREQRDRKRFPSTFSDFKEIRKDLKDWKAKALEESKSSQMKQQEHSKILETETNLLRNLDEAQRLRRIERKNQTEINALKVMANNKLWKSNQGEIISVETPATRRAKDLLITYNALKFGGVQEETESLDDFEKRWLECIVKAKWLVKANKSSGLLKQRVKLLKLLDREADLLTRRRNSKKRASLRNRISKLFFDLCMNKDFNPEAENINRN